MITVMGATGNTGRQICRALLAAGQSVRALGRSAATLAALDSEGAEPLVGDLTDVGYLARAFRGASAVYTLLPADRRAPDYRAAQREQGEATVRALRDSGVRHVVALSALGAEVDNGAGLIAGLHEQEERLKRLEGVNLLLLRPVSFFENFYEALGTIEHEGIVADSVAPDLPVPMIATRDIAEVAAKALRARDWTGVVVRELLGQRDLSYREATAILGAAMGRPDLPYVRLLDSEMVDALVGAGLSKDFARRYVELTRAINEGRIQPCAGRTAENTTPTTFEEFAGGITARSK